MATSTDSHDLNRFVEAQRDIYPQALAERRAGRKRWHWIMMSDDRCTYPVRLIAERALQWLDQGP